MNEIIMMLEGASHYFYQQNWEAGNEILSSVMGSLLGRVKGCQQPEVLLPILQQVAEQRNQQDWVLVGDLLIFELIPLLKEVKGL